MDTTANDGPAPVAAGWYDDPRDPSRMRKWDGSGWTDDWMRKAPGTRPRVPEIRDATTPAFRRLGLATRWALLVSAPFAVAEAGTTLWAWRRTGDWVGGASQQEVLGVDLTVTAVNLVSTAVWLVAGVLFLVWFVRAYRSDRVDSNLLEHGWGWAIGSWFVPVLNLFRPFQMVHDLVRGVCEPAGLPTRSLHRLVSAWWASVLASFALSVVAAFVVPALSSDLLGQLRHTYVLMACSAVLSAVGLVVVATVVHRLTGVMTSGAGPSVGGSTPS